MRFSVTTMVLIAATLTSAAIIPRNSSSHSRMEPGSFEERSAEIQVEDRHKHGRTHPREFMAPETEVPQRRTEEEIRDVHAQARRHPRDFPRRDPEPRAAAADSDESRPLRRRHPRDFPRREVEGEVVQARSAPAAARAHPRQFRSFENLE